MGKSPLRRSRILLLAAFWLAAGAAGAAMPPDGPVEGFAAAPGLPLKVIAAQIVPPGLPVVFGESVDQERELTWKGGPSWQKALQEAVAPAGLQVRIDQDRILIDNPPPPPWKRLAHWQAAAGRTLQDTVRDWSSRVGITAVIHGDYRYPIEAPVSYDGTYEDAVTHLVEAFSTAEPKPLLDIWHDGNNFTVELTEGGRQ